MNSLDLELTTPWVGALSWLSSLNHFKRQPLQETGYSGPSSSLRNVYINYDQMSGRDCLAITASYICPYLSAQTVNKTQVLGAEK